MNASKTSSKQTFDLPEWFLLGTATAALQIEGGDRNNSWYRWCEEGYIKDGSHCVRACDHWNRVDEDVELLRDLGCETYRMGLEWSRIEPEPGSFDIEALKHYRYEINTLLDTGIRPLVTLHHFSNPLWFEDRGGWTARDAAERFLNYVEVVVDYLGDLVSDWVTINEPNVYLSFGFLFGIWPPGERSIRGYIRGARQITLAHLRAYALIHERYSARVGDRVERPARAQRNTVPPRVGAAHHMRLFDPARDHPADRLVARLYDRFFQQIFIQGMTEGRFPRPFPGSRALRAARQRAQKAARASGGAQNARDASHTPLTSDFFGLNYYSRDMVRFAFEPAGAFGKTELPPDAPTNDLGWEIYPEGLLRTLRRIATYYPLPIFITENGTCDNDDRFRARFIHDHLSAVRSALDEGIDVRRYYHWSLMDNFEWLEGESARFGLIHVDYESGERRIRGSGRFYREICRNHGVTADTLARFVPGPSAPPR
jgi:beta-glucosidase